MASRRLINLFHVLRATNAVLQQNASILKVELALPFYTGIISGPEQCNSKGMSHVMYQIYYQIFDFNMSFYKTAIQEKHDMHLKEKSLARAEKEYFVKNTNVHMFSFIVLLSEVCFLILRQSLLVKLYMKLL